MTVVGLGHQSQLWWLRTSRTNLSAFPIPAYSHCLACVNISHQMVTWSPGSVLMWLTTSLYDLNSIREQTQKGSSSVFHSMLWLDIQTCCVWGPNSFMWGALGSVCSAVKAHIWRLSHCPLTGSSDVDVWWLCKISRPFWAEWCGGGTGHPFVILVRVRQLSLSIAGFLASVYQNVLSPFLFRREELSCFKVF